MISAVILTKNSSRTLKPLLEALRSIDVVLFDTGSTDTTLDIAKKFSNVQVFSRKIENKTIESDSFGFGLMKNEAASLAKNDWIFSIDSDELPDPSLVEFLLKSHLDPKTVYSFPFHNYYKEKRIYGCGWHPESHVRLYHRKYTKVSDDLIHERIMDEGCQIEKLSYPIKHFSYLCIDDFLQKMQRYSTLFATQNHKKKKSSFLKALGHGLFTFFKSYILKKGIFDGKEGIIISWYNSSVAFVKYLKLEEKNRC